MQVEAPEETLDSEALKQKAPSTLPSPSPSGNQKPEKTGEACPRSHSKLVTQPGAKAKPPDPGSGPLCHVPQDSPPEGSLRISDEEGDKDFCIYHCIYQAFITASDFTLWNATVGVHCYHFLTIMPIALTCKAMALLTQTSSSHCRLRGQKRQPPFIEPWSKFSRAEGERERLRNWLMQ